MGDEERYEADARSWLDSVDVPPSRLEVAQIVQIGRSQARRRRLLTAGGTVAAIAAVAAIPATMPMLLSGGTAQPGAPTATWPPPVVASIGPLATLRCEVTELPLPGLPAPEPDGSWSTGVVAMDQTGRYVLGYAVSEPSGGEDQAGRSEPFTILWDNGTPTHVPGVTEARDVNSRGVIVGGGWVYRDGVVQQLAVPDGYDTVRAEAINDAGDVVGTAHDEGAGGYTIRSAAVRWPGSDPGRPQILAEVEADADGNGSVAAYAVTDDGTAIGLLQAGGRNPVPYLWDADGEQRELPLPAEAVGAESIAAAAGDWVVGNAIVERPARPVPSELPPSADPDGADVGAPVQELELARWNVRTGTVQLIEPMVESMIEVAAFSADPDTSRAGEITLAVASGIFITGTTSSGPADPPNRDAAVLFGERFPYALPMPDGHGYRAEAINGDGTVIAGSRVVGSAEAATSTSRPVVWHCAD